MQDIHLVVEAIEELPFPVGKKLLGDILRGNDQNDSIKKNKLHTLSCFGSLAYEEREFFYLLKEGMRQGVIKEEKLEGTPFTVLKKGEGKKKDLVFSDITEEDKKLFEAFDFFLKDYNDEQKKAIASPKEKVLCVAGAGSGKTTVLTERIKFLTQFRGVHAKNILAITFTRKAKEEMEARLDIPVHIETFNSFCEKLLRKHNNLLYSQPVSVISWGEKIKLVHQALQLQGKTYEDAVASYFSQAQQRIKTYEQLCATFVNDCFTILDHFKHANAPLTDFSREVKKDQDMAKMVYLVCSYVEQAMVEQGKRDFSDQLVDCLRLFNDHDGIIPQYEHVLVDEYQDVNEVQEILLDKLSSKNLFCVGDPRQSIFGWRGSRIQYILDFQEKHEDAEVIGLKKNYRSAENIVKVMNKAIDHMQLPPLESNEKEGTITLLGFESEEEEHTQIVSLLKEPKETFILARTNKSLARLSEILQKEKIGHSVRNEDGEHQYGEGNITLATVHAIKGLEAERVLVISCNTGSFPCKSSDHPILDVVTFHDYDKEEEEIRLFYVALSRAKKELFITYHNTLTKYVTDAMQKHIEIPPEHRANALVSRLQSWRTNLSNQEKRPPYFIMHDATLQAIAAQQPLTMEELEDIPGMGPMKIQKYGDAILDVVHGL